MSSDLVNELLILQKWRDSSTLIKFRLTSPTFSVQAWAKVVAVTEDEVGIDLRDGAGFLAFNPSRCALLYQEPREADESVKERAEAMFVSALSVAMPEGVDLFLYEWVVEEEP